MRAWHAQILFSQARPGMTLSKQQLHFMHSPEFCSSIAASQLLLRVWELFLRGYHHLQAWSEVSDVCMAPLQAWGACRM